MKRRMTHEQMMLGVELFGLTQKLDKIFDRYNRRLHGAAIMHLIAAYASKHNKSLEEAGDFFRDLTRRVTPPHLDKNSGATPRS